MKKHIETVIKIIRKYSILLFILWFILVTFLGIDGINRNLYTLDTDFFFKGIFNNRIVLFLPIWTILLLRVTRDRESKLKKFFDDHSLLIFIILLNIFNLLKVLPFENYLSYIIRTVSSFFVVVAIIPFVRKILKAVNDGVFGEEFKKEKEENFKFSKKEILILLLLIVIALVARFISIDGLYPTTDEYLHLGQAKKEILPESVLYHNGEYERAYFVTWIIEFLFKTFGMTISMGRIPGIVISCLTVLLSYILFRKKNKTIAILSSVLYAFSPWSIMLSRTIREYIYFLPLYLCLGVYVYNRIKKIIDKKYKLRNVITDIFILFLLSYYSLVIDPLSTAKFSLIIYFGGFIYLCIYKLKEKEAKNNFKIDKVKRKHLFLAVLILFIVLVLANKFLGLSLEISQINIIPSFDASWVGYVFLNGEYGSLILGGIFLIFGLIPSIIKVFKEGHFDMSGYISILFIVIIYFFTFHFGRYYRPRYISIALPFIIYIQAEGFLFLKDFLFREFRLYNKKQFILILLLMNWAYIFYGFSVKGTGYVKISQEFHEGYELVYEEIKDIDNEYILVTTLPDAADWYFDTGITEILSISYSDPDMELILDNIIASNERGYFVIDSRRNTWAGNIFRLDETYTTVSGYKLKFVSSTDVYMIYKWDRSTYAKN